MGGLDRTWRWRVAHADIAEIAEALEPVVAKSAPLLRRMRYVVSGPDDVVEYDGELRRALRHVTDPFSIQVRYSDAGRSLSLGSFWVEVTVHNRRSGAAVDLRTTGPGSDATDDRMEHARERVDAELESRGWKSGDAEIVKSPHETASPPRPPSPLEADESRLGLHEAAQYLGLSLERIRTLIASGNLPSEVEKQGNRTRHTVAISDLETYRLTHGRNKKRATDALPATPTSPRSTPAGAPTQNIADAGVKPTQSKQHINGVDVSAKSSAPGRWRRFWDSKLGQFVTDHVFGTFLLGALAAIVGGAVIAVVLKQGADTPPIGPTPTPPSMPSTSPVAPTAQEEREIHVATEAQFFDGAVVIHVDSALAGASILGVSTAELSCPGNFLKVGDSKVFLGVSGGVQAHFRVTLVKTAMKASLVRVGQLPGDQPPPDGTVSSCQG